MNVLYLHTHDTGRVVSPYGYAVETPRIQEFCEDAMLFQRAFCVAPTCSPSRAGLLTGTYPHQNGMLGLAQRGFRIDGSRHLARLLAHEGFLSVLCGVQHEVGYYTDHQLAPEALGYEMDLTTDASGYARRTSWCGTAGTPSVWRGGSGPTTESGRSSSRSASTRRTGRGLTPTPASPTTPSRR